jgi:hypothetical protein
LTCEAAPGPAEALRRAVSMAGGNPVLFLYEKLGAAREALRAIGAEAVPFAGTVTPVR